MACKTNIPQRPQHRHTVGKVPILILVGDDFQLPPITPGAFECMVDSTAVAHKLQNSNEKRSCHRANGEALFIDCATEVMELTTTKRQQTHQL